MEVYREELNKFCDLYEQYRGKLSLAVFSRDTDAYMTGVREVREAAKKVGARYLADIFDDHVNMSKDDSLDIAEHLWGSALLEWERVVSGIAIYLRRSIELVATLTGRMNTNGIRLHTADVNTMANDVLDLLVNDEYEDAVASMDRILTYDMSETNRLKLVKASRAMNRRDFEEAKESLRVMLS